MAKNRSGIKNVLIISNPFSGSPKKKALIEKIVILLTYKGIRVTYQKLTSRQEMIAFVKNAAREGAYDLIATAGGDGTLRDTLAACSGTDVPVAVIPAGTGNVFASEMKIPRKPKKWVKYLLRGGAHRIDGGLVNGNYFLMMTGVGFDAYTVQSTEWFGLKKYFGRALYVAGFIKSASEYAYPSVQIVVDNEIHDAGYGVIVSNTERYGVYFTLTPGARCDDGYLDCLIYRERGIRGVIKLFVTAFFAFIGAGKKIRLTQKVSRYRCKTLKIMTSQERKIPVQIDGDVVGALPIEVSVVKHVFNVWLPAKVLAKKRKMSGQ